MSNIVHKVKEVVTGHHDKPSHSTNAGPHDSNVANKADPRVDSDRDNRGAYSAAGAGTGTGTGGYNTNTTTSGPHSSTLANKADPRVDSDRGQYGTTGGVTSGGAYDSNPRSTNAGPHSSNLANKADPRVDSDRDNRGAYSAAGTGNTTAGTGIRSGTGAGTGTGAYGSTNTTTSGPHSSNLANKADPRVDSDRGQYGTTGGVTAGGAYDTNPRSTNAGPHSSNLANKVDPRVDSDLDNRARHQNLGGNTAPAGSSYATPGSGAAQQTAGPHDKNILNKLDPRVDSDLDNSRTIGNATRY